MDETVREQPSKRSIKARIGIAALNLIAPGLGLFRVGSWRLGTSCLIAPFVVVAILAFLMGHLPITSYFGALFALVVVLGLSAALYVVPAVLTWRDSGDRSATGRWSRWYGLTAIAMATLLAMQLVVPIMHHFYKPFYAPSESMAPTIEKGDKFIVDMRWRGPLVRGTIVVFRGPDSDRVSRIAAIPGDTIAMRNGVPFVNGTAATELPQGQATFMGYGGSYQAAIFGERFPGETFTHRTLDAGPSEFDNTAEATVPADHFFVLGDNRDRAADSRVPAEFEGVGMVPVTALVGRPMYIHWSGNRAKIGTRLDR